MHTAILLSAMACALHPHHYWARPFPASGPSACQSCTVPLPGHGPGMYDYRTDFDYPWSNVPCAGYSCNGAYVAQANEKVRQVVTPLRLSSARGEPARQTKRKVLH